MPRSLCPDGQPALPGRVGPGRWLGRGSQQRSWAQTGREEEGVGLGFLLIDGPRLATSGNLVTGEQRPMRGGVRCAGKGLGWSCQGPHLVWLQGPRWTATSALGRDPRRVPRAAGQAPEVALADHVPHHLPPALHLPSLHPVASMQGTRASRPALPHPPMATPSRCPCARPALQSSGRDPSSSSVIPNPQVTSPASVTCW